MRVTIEYLGFGLGFSRIKLSSPGEKTNVMWVFTVGPFHLQYGPKEV